MKTARHGLSWFAATLIWLTAACGGVGAEDILSARLSPRDWGVDGAPTPDGVSVGRLTLVSVIVLTGPDLGGLSGLAVDPKGERFIAVSDVDGAVTGRLVRDARGVLTDVIGGERRRLFTHPVGKIEADAEEITSVPDGGWLVAFERHHRVLRYGPELAASGAGRLVPPPPGLAAWPGNGGIEAMTVTGDGRLMLMAEGGEDDPTERPVWLAKWPPRGSEDWIPARYEQTPGFRPTGLTTTPGGGVLVLERRFTMLEGPTARVKWLSAEMIRSVTPGSTVTLRGEEVAWLRSPAPVDNFEGIAAVARDDGLTDVFILSDDNFNPLQNTLLAHLVGRLD